MVEPASDVYIEIYGATYAFPNFRSSNVEMNKPPRIANCYRTESTDTFSTCFVFFVSKKPEGIYYPLFLTFSCHQVRLRLNAHNT